MRRLMIGILAIVVLGMLPSVSQARSRYGYSRGYYGGGGYGSHGGGGYHGHSHGHSAFAISFGYSSVGD